MIEVPMTERPASRPSFEEYVTARGTALLRTAWLLTGDHHRAEDLVQTALGKTWPHWSRIAERGEGAYDAYVRRVMMTTYIAWWRRRWNGEYPPEVLPELTATSTESPTALTTELRQDVLKALARLPRDSVRLWCSVTSRTSPKRRRRKPLAAASGRSRASAHAPWRPCGEAPRSRARRCAMPEFETLLREALREAVPQDLEQSGLAEDAKAYAVRVRRLRVVSTAVVAAVVVLIAVVASSGMFRNRAVAPAKPQTEHVNVCDYQVGVTPLRAAPVAPASTKYQHVLVCALTDSDSAWPGSLPPDWSVDTPEAIDSLTWGLRDDAADCGGLPAGRAFTVSVQEHNGTISTYLNTDLRCSGWEFLERYYVALAEQRWQHERAVQEPWPNCPSVFGEQPPRSDAPLAKGTVLSEASLCLHPVPRAVTEVPLPRGQPV